MARTRALVTLFLIGLSSLSSFSSPPATGAQNSLFQNASVLFAKVNTTETGPVVHTNPYIAPSRSTPDQYGNFVETEIHGFGLNPLNNGDPSYDFFIFVVYVDSNAGKGWSIDTGGLGDGNGPSLNVTLEVPGGAQQCSSTAFFKSEISPSQEEDTSGGSVDLGIKVGPISVGATIPVPITQTKPNVISECRVQWLSGINNFGEESTYQYAFIAGVRAARNQHPHLLVSVVGNFFARFCYPNCRDRVTLSFDQQFAMPPTTHIDSEPGGTGYVLVDGKPIVTPKQFVWNLAENHTVTALSPVLAGPQTCYVFEGWSDGGGQSHIISSNLVRTNYVASFRQADISVCQPKAGPDLGEIAPYIAIVLIVLILSIALYLRRSKKERYS